MVSNRFGEGRCNNECGMSYTLCLYLKRIKKMPDEVFATAEAISGTVEELFSRVASWKDGAFGPDETFDVYCPDIDET